MRDAEEGLAELGFRFLGNAGFQLLAQGQSLAVDPFFTRPPFLRQYWGRVTPNRDLAAERLPRCDHVLVTCARWDHLMDVPAVVAHTGARAYGPPRVVELLRLLGAPKDRIERLAVGQVLHLGPFAVEVLPADHGWTPHDWFLNGALPRRLAPPLRLRDYRMVDRYDNLSFRISAGGIRLWLRGVRPLSADVALISPLRGRPAQVRARYARLLEQVCPKMVILLHWDDLFRPLTKGLRPMLLPTGRLFPPLAPVDLGALTKLIKALRPSVTVFVPEGFCSYDLASILRGDR